MWPRRARRPTVPDPGSTRRPSSSRTVTQSRIVKAGPTAGRSKSSTVPAAPVSDAPNESVTSTPGTRARSSSFTAFERIAPPDPIAVSADRS